MKVIKRFKIGLALSVALMLTVSACGRGTTTSTLGYTTYGTCTTATTGTNVYTGTIGSCVDFGGCYPNEIPLNGSLVLSVYASGAGATITGTLNINGNTYCCSSSGTAYLTTAYYQYQQEFDATYMMNGVSLICQPSGGTGYGYGSYQTATLRSTATWYDNIPPMLTSTQRLMGSWTFSSGGLNLGGNSDVPIWVE